MSTGCCCNFIHHFLPSFLCAQETHCWHHWVTFFHISGHIVGRAQTFSYSLSVLPSVLHAAANEFHVVIQVALLTEQWDCFYNLRAYTYSITARASLLASLTYSTIVCFHVFRSSLWYFCELPYQHAATRADNFPSTSSKSILWLWMQYPHHTPQLSGAAVFVWLSILTSFSAPNPGSKWFLIGGT